MSAELLDRLSVVLVRPKHPGNIGAVARAMKNMGLSRLEVVGSAKLAALEARKMASGATDLLDSATVYPSLKEALAEKGLVAGTTARFGKNRSPVYSTREAAPLILEQAAPRGAALVFGPEDRGLENWELDLCNVILTIPTSREFSSLNLGQAVLIVCYEIRQVFEEMEGIRIDRQGRGLASSTTMEGMYDHLQSVLEEIGFLHPSNPRRIMTTLRRIFGRAGLTERDARIVRGICRQIRWFARERGKYP